MAARLANLAGLLFFRFLRAGGHAAPMANAPGNLSGWRDGDEGVVLGVQGNTRLSSRLRELGVAPGVRVRVLRAGCPTVIQVEEGRFCLRKADAACILTRRTA